MGWEGSDSLFLQTAISIGSPVFARLTLVSQQSEPLRPRYATTSVTTLRIPVMYSEEFSSRQHVKLWSTCVLFRPSLCPELTS